MGWVASIVNNTQDLLLPEAWKMRLSYLQPQHANAEAARDALLVTIDLLTAKNNMLMQDANLDPALTPIEWNAEDGSTNSKINLCSHTNSNQ